jgi:hypothetical protein
MDAESEKRLAELYDQLIYQGLQPIASSKEGSQKSTKRGPVTYSDDEKLRAIRDWENLDSHSQKLKAWLGYKFGSENGFPKVAVSTFYEWRRKLKDKGLLDP